MSEATTFDAAISAKMLDFVSRQIAAINDLAGSETKPEVLSQLSFDLMWLQFGEFSIIAGAEFGWSIEQCYNFEVYGIYKFKEELEKRKDAKSLVLSKSAFPSWLLNRDTVNLPLHEQKYPFYEVKLMSMTSLVGLNALINRMLNSGDLPNVSAHALQNSSAVPFLEEDQFRDGL